MFRYETLVRRLEEKLPRSLPKRLEDARLYWGPRNFSRRSIRERLGQDVLFDEWILMETGKNRWLVDFRDKKVNTTDPQEVMEAILNCKNWKRYSDLWKRKAPPHIRSKALLLHALVDITVQGGRTEKAFEDRMKAEGRDVRRSSSKEDAGGIDFWVDGRGVQVKSEGTKKAARRSGKGKDWA